MALLLIALSQLQPFYTQGQNSQTPSPPKNPSCIISSDQEGRYEVVEAALNDTIFIQFKIDGLSIAYPANLYVNDMLVKGVPVNDNSRLIVPISLVTASLDKPDSLNRIVNFGIGIQGPVFRSGKFKLVYQPFFFAYARSDSSIKAKPGQQVWIRSELNADQSHQMVYINDFPVSIGKLVKGKENLYFFTLKNKVLNTDSLASLFNPGNSDSVSVKIKIGSTFDSRKEIPSKLVIVFDEWKGTRRYISMIVALIIIMILVCIYQVNKLGILRDSANNPLNVKPPFSLAKSQMAFWTMIILVAYFFIWHQTGALIHITAQVLILLGISAGTTLSANIIDNRDIADPNISRHQDGKKSSNNFLLNILSDQTGVSIHRFQNVAFTIAIGGYFLYEVFIHKIIPDLDTNLMVLMGISSATYIAVKQGENKPETPIG